jgi:hypothetical protein
MVTPDSIPWSPVRVLDADHDHRPDRRPFQSAAWTRIRVTSGPEQEPVRVVEVERQLPCTVTVQLVTAARQQTHGGQRLYRSKVFQSLLDFLGAHRSVPFPQVSHVSAGQGEIDVLERYLQRMHLLLKY